MRSDRLPMITRPKPLAMVMPPAAAVAAAAVKPKLFEYFTILLTPGEAGARNQDERDDQRPHLPGSERLRQRVLVVGRPLAPLGAGTHPAGRQPAGGSFMNRAAMIDTPPMINAIR